MYKLFQFLSHRPMQDINPIRYGKKRRIRVHKKREGVSGQGQETSRLIPPETHVSMVRKVDNPI